MDLKTYYLSLPLPERKPFADRCGVAHGHLRNIVYGTRACPAHLAISVERESGGAVTCEESCPDADWGYLRGTKSRERKAVAK